MIGPTQEYHNPRSHQSLPKRGGRSAQVDVLEAAGSGELPDSVLTEARRTELREEVRTDAARLSDHEAMYKAGAYETEARAKRARESLAG
jgi:hypothetical protein